MKIRIVERRTRSRLPLQPLPLQPLPRYPLPRYPLPRYPLPRYPLALSLLALCLALAGGEGLALADDTPSDPSAIAIAAYDDALELTDRNERLDAFARAALQFKRALRSGAPENADLWTNLGNACLGAEDLGGAIHAFKSALRLDPDHARAHGNLGAARQLLPGWVPRPEEGGALDTFLFWHSRLSPAERSILAALSFLIAAAMLSVGIARRRSWLRNLALVPVFGWGALLITSPGFDTPTKAAVIVVDDTMGRAADSSSAPSKFAEPLPSGVEVDILEEREAWRRIGLSDGREAWVPTSAVWRLGAVPE